MFRLLDGDVGKRLQELVGKQGLQILGWWENGFRHVSNSKRPIVKADDIRGLKLRTLPSPVHVAFFRKLGAIPTPMDWAEVMPALQQGVIDGQENPTAIIDSSKLYEVQRYLTLWHYSFDPLVLCINKKLFDGLPAADQQVVAGATVDTLRFRSSPSAEPLAIERARNLGRSR